MLRNTISLRLVHRNFTIAMAQVIVLGLIVLPLAGCDADGGGGPAISSLSTPTDNSPSMGAASDTDSATTAPGGKGEQEDPMVSMTSGPMEDMIPESDEPEPPGTGSDEIDDPSVSVTSTPTGATARLTWDASADPNVEGYFVHYGKQSSSEYASCSYEESQRVGAPPATITGLDPNTVYFFAISAFGESQSEAESPCSNEVTVVTPSVQS